ncbi:hypothetical protein ABZX51_007716 [Aspergillus tubingensis]
MGRGGYNTPETTAPKPAQPTSSSRSLSLSLSLSPLSSGPLLLQGRGGYNEQQPVAEAL